MKSVTLNVPTGLAKEFAAEMAALCKKYEVETDGLKYLLPVTERIKTFEDACNELTRYGGNTLVQEYEEITDLEIEISSELVAYLKLRIIVAALNEGWEPEFRTDEYRWYPWFLLYTQKEIDRMDDADKGRVLGRSHSNANANAGVAYSRTSYASSISSSYCGARLCFKTEELAKYAGTQFLKEWSDFMGFTK